jgi:tRNA threonylcarbamoyladenosine biosynthesis protein TsaE
MEFITTSVEETIELGEKLAGKFKGGEIIALSGELGAGKTQFVKGIGKALGITREISSPTFVIVQTYSSGRLPLIHMDLYRLDSVESLEDMGWYDFLDINGVIVIEWAEKMQKFLPAENTIFVKLTFEDLDTRKIKLMSGGGI